MENFCIDFDFDDCRRAFEDCREDCRERSSTWDFSMGLSECAKLVELECERAGALIGRSGETLLVPLRDECRNQLDSWMLRLGRFGACSSLKLRTRDRTSRIVRARMILAGIRELGDHRNFERGNFRYRCSSIDLESLSNDSRPFGAVACQPVVCCVLDIVQTSRNPPNNLTIIGSRSNSNVCHDCLRISRIPRRYTIFLVGQVTRVVGRMVETGRRGGALQRYRDLGFLELKNRKGFLWISRICSLRFQADMEMLGELGGEEFEGGYLRDLVVILKLGRAFPSRANL